MSPLIDELISAAALFEDAQPKMAEYPVARERFKRALEAWTTYAIKGFVDSDAGKAWAAGAKTT